MAPYRSSEKFHKNKHLLIYFKDFKILIFDFQNIHIINESMKSIKCWYYNILKFKLYLNEFTHLMLSTIVKNDINNFISEVEFLTMHYIQKVA